MAENYKHLYEQTKKMLTMYQDNLIPGFRQKIDELEADNERLRKGWAEAISSYSKADSQIPRWIPVTERLPEELPKKTCAWSERVRPSVDVLVKIKGLKQLYTAWYSYSHQEWTDVREEHSFTGVTHWMPLPELPKEG